MGRFGVLLAIIAGPLAAEPLTGEGIAEVLTGKVVTYESGAWQDFRASGRTLYNAGRDSWGYWAVRAGQYCSKWPPSDLWACYDMEEADDVLRWIGAAGDVTEGRVTGRLD